MPHVTRYPYPSTCHFAFQYTFCLTLLALHHRFGRQYFSVLKTKNQMLQNESFFLRSLREGGTGCYSASFRGRCFVIYCFAVCFSKSCLTLSYRAVTSIEIRKNGTNSPVREATNALPGSDCGASQAQHTLRLQQRLSIRKPECNPCCLLINR